MTLYDHKAKIYYIGIEHLNTATARRVLFDYRNVYDVMVRDVRRHVLKNYDIFKNEGYSLILFANWKNKVLIYNAK